MWNEEKGFGFVTPEGGGEDVFVHRSALGEGVTLSAGAPVSYDESWDEKRRKHKALNVAVSPVGASRSSESGGRGGSVSQQPHEALKVAKQLHIVGTFSDWSISKQPMDEDGTRVRHRLVIRSSAPAAKSDAKLRREEFQIVGDAEWKHRFYPDGHEKEEVVVLTPGGSPSRAVASSSRGHGRNWAVEGRPGAAFDILFDREASNVSCEQAFKEEKR